MGWHDAPSALQLSSDVQLPHEPPQPSLPHFLPVHIGVQHDWYAPLATSVCPVAHAHLPTPPTALQVPPRHSAAPAHLPSAPQASAAAPPASLAGENSYAAKLTAASVMPSNVPQRPGPPISIDVHCHWAQEVYMKA